MDPSDFESFESCPCSFLPVEVVGGWDDLLPLAIRDGAVVESGGMVFEMLDFDQSRHSCFKKHKPFLIYCFTYCCGTQ